MGEKLFFKEKGFHVVLELSIQFLYFTDLCSSFAARYYSLVWSKLSTFSF